MLHQLLRSRRTWAAAIVAALALAVQWYLTAYPRGMLMAYIDHARGHYKVLEQGDPYSPRAHEEYARLLEERYGVGLEAVGEGFLADKYAGGYNQVSTYLLFRKHGKNVLSRCYNLARKKCREERGDQ
jgi:hypothetical protein